MAATKTKTTTDYTDESRNDPIGRSHIRAIRAIRGKNIFKKRIFGLGRNRSMSQRIWDLLAGGQVEFADGERACRIIPLGYYDWYDCYLGP